jgi:hypothetical protein
MYASLSYHSLPKFRINTFNAKAQRVEKKKRKKRPLSKPVLCVLCDSRLQFSCGEIKKPGSAGFFISKDEHCCYQ